MHRLSATAAAFLLASAGLAASATPDAFASGKPSAAAPVDPAAAAPAVEMVCAGAVAPPVETAPFVPTFHADRPFVFIIRDTKTGVVLFVGRIARPEA